MTVTTTFGYNAGEDRIWISCNAWPQRVWLTRRLTTQVLTEVAAALEQGASVAEGDTRPVAERVAAEHDDSLNKPRQGEQGGLLHMGRESPRAQALAAAALCTQFTLRRGETHTDLLFVTTAGERRLHLTRVGLHRWLHALHLVVSGTAWSTWTPMPQWLTRSYLPPALKSLLAFEPPPGHRPEDAAGDDPAGLGPPDGR